ncbi:MAG: hypothetical protein Q8859_03285 [Bacteroidota bacterium]|nr:hypothetical protein [Bacteroidota bacterium]
MFQTIGTPLFYVLGGNYNMLQDATPAEFLKGISQFQQSTTKVDQPLLYRSTTLPLPIG